MNDRYELVRELGKSPYAHTALFTEKESGRQCVIKSLDPGEAADLKIIELFRREARVLRNLEHEAIPRLVDFFEEQTESSLTLNLVQEYVPGHDLAEVLETDGPLAEQRVLGIARQLLDVLRYIHGFSPPVIHRDIKPSNLILSDHDEVHLIDFSGARDRMMQDREPGGGGFTIVGTYGYMPYEQYEGRALPASDIYSSGMTLLYLLSGKEPMDLERDGMRSIVPDDLDVSSEFRDFLTRMIEPDWKERFQTAGEAIAALDELTRRTPGGPGLLRPAIMLPAAALVAILSLVVLRDETGPPAEPSTAPLETAASQSPDELTEIMKRRLEAAPSEQGPPIAANAEPDLVVTLLWGKRPFIEESDLNPRFSLWSSTLGKRVNASFRYANGVVEVFGVPDGTSRLEATLLTDRGDFEATWGGSAQFVLDPRAKPSFEIDMQRHMVLRGPPPIRDATDCGGGAPSPVVASWEALGNGVHYNYEIIENGCGGNDTKPRAVVRAGSSTKTELTLDLPPSPPGRYYSLDLQAQIRGTLIGRGNLPFRVAD